LPTLELPDSLFSAEVGITKIDEYTAVEAAAGDWLLIRNFSESLLPIPIGWTAASSPNGGTYTYGIGPDSVNYLLTMGVFCGMETFEEQVQVSEAEIATLPQGSLLKTTLIGDVAYIRYRFYHPTQGDFFDLLLFLSYQAEGCPYLAIGGARDGMWGDFYPAMREIVSHWFTLEGEQIGVELPESMD
jgi:hypothetical protein